LGNEACITIADGTACSLAGNLPAHSDGSFCSHLISATSINLTLNETLDFLNAQPQRFCVPVLGMPICADDQLQGTQVMMSARGAAIFMSDQDWNTMKTELEEACRELGSSCSYATQSMIARFK
jgi:hypothetical protein